LSPLPVPSCCVRDEAIPEAVKAWRVTYVPIEREARHMDRTAQMDMFAAIESFHKARNCRLQF